MHNYRLKGVSRLELCKAMPGLTSDPFVLMIKSCNLDPGLLKGFVFILLHMNYFYAQIIILCILVKMSLGAHYFIH